MISHMYDDSKRTDAAIQGDISILQQENKALKSNVAQYDEKCQNLSYDILDLKARSMQQNLLFLV